MTLYPAPLYVSLPPTACAQAPPVPSLPTLPQVVSAQGPKAAFSSPKALPVGPQHLFFSRRRFLRETLKMSNAEDLNRLTACSLVLLGHIFYVLGNHRVSVRGQAEGHRSRVVLSGVEVGEGGT